MWISWSFIFDVSFSPTLCKINWRFREFLAISKATVWRVYSQNFWNYDSIYSCWVYSKIVIFDDLMVNPRKYLPKNAFKTSQNFILFELSITSNKVNFRLLFYFLKLFWVSPSIFQEISSQWSERIFNLNQSRQGGTSVPSHFQNSSKKIISHRFRVIKV